MATKEPIITRARRVPTITKSTAGLKIYDENAVPSKIPTKKPVASSNRVALSDISNFSEKENKEQKSKRKEVPVTNQTKQTTSFKTTTNLVILPQAKRAPIVPKQTRQASAMLKPVSSSNPFGLNENRDQGQSRRQQEVSKIKAEDPMEVETRETIRESESEGELNIEDLDEASAPPAAKRQAISYFQEIEEEEIDELVEDIDLTDHDDPQFCTEYVSYIMDNLRQREKRDQPSSNYMEQQMEITERHRSILVDWMVEVSGKFNFVSETVYLSVSLLDRFLQQKVVAKNKLQLVGLTAMLIASKFEEIYTPEVNDFVIISANTFSKEDLLKMERLMLVTLDFNINVSIHLHFLRRFSKAAHSDSKIHTISKYLVELSLLDYKMIKYLPSRIAAASVYISRRMCGISPAWNKTLDHYTLYTESDIKDCVHDLNRLVIDKGTSKCQAIYNKYRADKFMRVADIPPVVDL